MSQPTSPGRRLAVWAITSLTLFILAALVLVILGPGEQEGGRVTIEVLGSKPIEGINAAPASGVGAGDPPRITVPDTPPSGRILHVNAKARDGGDGSQAAPWRDLQQALCALRPGDRLLVWSGHYASPVAIDGDCQNGTRDRPIEVFASDDALLEGPIQKTPLEGAILTIARSHWRIGGLEIHPGALRVGMLVAPDVQDVIINSPHIVSGIGSGIEIAHGASDITVNEAHLHQLGTLEGRSKGYQDVNAAAIRIAPGTRSIRVLKANVHNIMGKPVQVIEPKAYPHKPGLKPAVDITAEGSFQEHQEKWW